MSVVRSALRSGPTSADTAVAQYARQRAWTVVSIAFLVWCSVAVGALAMLMSHRRSATDMPTADLTIDRGTVFYQGPSSPGQTRARGDMVIQEGGVVEVGDGGRAGVRLFDGSTVTLLPDSRLQLATVRIGRYNSSLTELSLDLLAGAANFEVAGTLPSGRSIRVATPFGVVSLDKGSYLVWVQDERVRVASFMGRASIGSEAGTVRLDGGQRGVLSAAAPPDGPFPLTESLVRNGDFSRQFQEWTMLDKGEPGRPDVGGNRRLVEETIAGRNLRALQIVRDSPKDAFNETGVVQEINQDVSAYRSISLTAWVKVNYASLSGGGYLGSEYPVMLRVNYTDERGGRPGWTHGFYYANPENRPTTNGELIARGEWYPFLARLSELPERPAFIQSIEVLSAGHDFDAVVADVRLNVE